MNKDNYISFSYSVSSTIDLVDLVAKWSNGRSLWQLADSSRVVCISCYTCI